MGAIYYKGEKYGAMPASAANLPYEAGSQDSTKDKIDANANNVSNIQTQLSNSNISNFTVVKDVSFAAGTTTEQCINNLITTYGKKTICFGYVLTGVGWFTGVLTFHSDTQGGGFLVAMGNGKLWAITYVNGNVNIYEK